MIVMRCGFPTQPIRDTSMNSVISYRCSCRGSLNVYQSYTPFMEVAMGIVLVRW